jgi:hypothetical protein
VWNTKIEYRLFSTYGNIWDYGWLSFYSVFEDFEIDLGTSKKDFIQFRNLIESGVFNMIQLDGLCVVSSLPKYVKRNQSYAMHSTNSSAIEFRDGYKQHYLNGIFFPEDLWTKVISKKMSFKEILEIVDVDQRNQALLLVGDEQRDEWLKHVKAEVIDEYTKQTINGNPVYYKLYKIPKGDVFRDDCYAMWYTCPSTNKQNFSRVPQFNTVAEAMAWKGSDDENILTSEVWKLAVPLLDES